MNGITRDQYLAARGPFKKRTYISAGAGAGKTTVLCLAYGEVRSLEEEICPEEPPTIAVVTFTYNAAEEVAARLAAAGRPKPWHVGTFHSMVLKRFPELKVADEWLAEELKQEAMKRYPKEAWPEPGVIAGWAKVVASSPGELKISSRAYTYYIHMLTADGMVDYDGVLRHAAANAHEFKDVIMLVDEFQDSGPAELIVYAHAKQLIVAGDSRQVLYEFRGASPDSKRGFDDYRSLGVSFRCPERICNWVNSFIGDEIDGPLRSNDPGIAYQLRVDRLDQIGLCGTQPYCADVVLCRSNRDVVAVQKTMALLGRKTSEASNLWATEPTHRLFAAWVAAKAYKTDAAIARYLRLYGGELLLRNTLAVAAEKMTDLASVTDLWEFGLKASGKLDWPELAEMVVLAGCADCDYAQLALRISQSVRQVERTEGTVVMTIHGAKGLEWDHVQLYWPHYRGTEEDKRLLYVAATRAKKTFGMIDCGQPFPPLLD